MTERIVVLTGGVGGAKLVLGLMEYDPTASLTAIVNTGDDFRHMGLYISPDIDTLLYTLSGKANKAQGWGREGESWGFMAALRELGGEDWFALGDGDLALHLLRTMRLEQGESLSVVTRDFAKAWGIGCTILPMSDMPVATCLSTDEGVLEFQRYFVERRCAPRVKSIEFRGSRQARAAPGVVEAIMHADTILIAPSNPYLSVDPLLAIADIHEALLQCAAPVVAVSPIIGGKAVKGPTAKLMEELGIPVDNGAIARHYAGIISGLLIDSADATPDGVAVAHTNTLMRDSADRIRVALAALNLAHSIAP